LHECFSLSAAALFSLPVKVKVPSAVIRLCHPYQYHLYVSHSSSYATHYLRRTVMNRKQFFKKRVRLIFKSNRTYKQPPSNRLPDVDTAHNFTSNEPAHVRTIINRLPQVETAHDFCSNESAHVQTINRSPGDSARVRLHESAHVQAISRLSDAETVHRLKCSNSYINQQLTASTSTSSRRSTGGASIQSNTLPLA